MFADTILVLVPHPDDEIVGAAAAIMRARARGARVLLANLTDGVPSRETVWPWRRKHHARLVATRRTEAAEAARRLGAERVFEQNVATRLLRHNLRTTLGALRDVVRAYAVDCVWVPAYEGGHQDHDTTNFLGALLRALVPVWEFSEYHYANARVHSQQFIHTNGTEQTLELDDRERALKRALLRLYRSERGNLDYVQVHREQFRPLPRYDYRLPPHQGRAFYQRFQWVPRHPRIDYTKPEDVCRTLDQFGTALAKLA